MPRETHNPDTLFNSVQYGFSQIAVGSGSRIVTISGQVGWDQTGKMVPPGDFKTQTMTAFHNLGLAMQAVGGTLEDILLLHIYIVATAMEESSAVREALQHFFPTSPPASSWIGVPRLANADFLIEVEAIAVLK